MRATRKRKGRILGAADPGHVPDRPCIANQHRQISHGDPPMAGIMYGSSGAHVCRHVLQVMAGALPTT